jgi:CBS domain-containing protein
MIVRKRSVIFVERILPVAPERPVTIKNDALLTKAARLLGDRHTNLAVVCDNGGAMVGVVTKTDVVRKISHCRGSGCTAAVAAVMTENVTYFRPGDLLKDIWSIMKEPSLLHVPIVGEDFRLLGVINAWDALFALLEGAEYEESLLREC